jgi:uncharacterized membrane protein
MGIVNIPRILRDNKLVAFSALLGLSVLGCASLYGLRVLMSGRVYYLYLLQNIFLAFVRGERARRLLLAPAALLWLLFYPNAPYIFTDFIHLINKVYLRVSPTGGLSLNTFLWYDLVMTAAFAFIGHFIGLVSMWIMQKVMSPIWGRGVSRGFLGAAMILAGFGIYLGRFSRLNSWDAILAPFRVAGEVVEAFADPMALFFTFAFALFILLSYGSLSSFKRIELPPGED